MLQVTAVWSPCGLNVNSVVLVPSNGFTNSTLIFTRSLGWLSVSVIRPSPILSLPPQAKIAPGPAGGPPNVALAAGSSFAQGDHACQLWKLFTCAKTSGVGAATVAVRTTWNSDGCMATYPTNTTAIAASAMSIVLSITPSCSVQFRHVEVLPARHVGHVVEFLPERPRRIDTD